MAKEIERYRAVIDVIEKDVATITLLKKDGEPKAIIDVPEKDLLNYKIPYQVETAFDFIVQLAGNRETFIFVPAGPKITEGEE